MERTGVRGRGARRRAEEERSGEQAGREPGAAAASEQLGRWRVKVKGRGAWQAGPRTACTAPHCVSVHRAPALPLPPCPRQVLPAHRLRPGWAGPPGFLLLARSRASKWLRLPCWMPRHWLRAAHPNLVFCSLSCSVIRGHVASSFTAMFHLFESFLCCK